MAWPDTSEISPVEPAVCEQDRLEPILKSEAERLGADIRFHTEFISLEQDHYSIQATIQNRSNERRETITASYLIAADGIHSKVRDQVGIERHGPGILQNWLNVIFETDMSHIVKGNRFTAAMLEDINGTLVPRDSGRWSMSCQYHPEKGDKKENYDERQCEELIRRAAGSSDIKIEIVDMRAWEAAAFVADQFKEQRVFLIGDAAHVMPPTGGFGGNTGIHDAYNLAWKIAAVLRGRAAQQMSETYEGERKPVAINTMKQALARLQAWFNDPAKKLPEPVEIEKDENVVFGYLYKSGAIMAEKKSAEDIGIEDPYHPTGKPGSRAPSLSVTCNGERRSTIDIFSGHWVLLTGLNGDRWLQASKELKFLKAYQVGTGCELDCKDNRWTDTFGIKEDGAVLIRPDGFVAWRTQSTSDYAEQMLHTVWHQLLMIEDS